MSQNMKLNDIILRASLQKTSTWKIRLYPWHVPKDLKNEHNHAQGRSARQRKRAMLSFDGRSMLTGILQLSLRTESSITTHKM